MTESYAVAVEDALERLDVIPDYDAGDGPQPCVHTFSQAAFGLIGAHWDLPTAEAFMRRWGVEESGPDAQSMGHGLVTVSQEDQRSRTIFFATRTAPADPPSRNEAP